MVSVNASSTAEVSIQSGEGKETVTFHEILCNNVFCICFDFHLQLTVIDITYYVH